ncbi:hypothetical protein ACFYUR_16815 [Micromonospora haikouensis]|uniref:hypothetical protein n=1 Tax=Micromonospora haikouensis TaxID=686309 RepID=UPI0036AB37AA
MRYVTIEGIGAAVGGFVGSGNVRISKDSLAELTLWSVDGGAPKLQLNVALPTASSTYRGRMFRLEGATGVADATYVCQKNASDAYVWTAIA